jgi:zinc protease
MIDQIDYAKVIELYKNRFKDASDFTFILIGNIDQATALPLIEKYLGGLPSINRKEDFRNVVEIRKGQSRNVFHKELQKKLPYSCSTAENVRIH